MSAPPALPRSVRSWARIRRLPNRLADAPQQGQALVMVGLMIMTLIGFVALAVDTGIVWMNRRSLQNAADAAALAGVQALPEAPATAIGVGCDYADKNAVAGIFGKVGTCSMQADITISTTYYPNDTITAKVYKRIDPTFGIAVGFASVEVGATAKAMVGSIGESCPFPLFQTPELLPGGSPESMEFYTLTAMHLAGADNQKGNFLTVDVGSGASAVLDAMVNNDCSNPMGLTASTEPGGKIGKVVDGFQWRVYCASGAGSPPNQTPSCPSGGSTCQSADITEYLILVDGEYQLDPGITRDNCTRLVVIPIFPGPFSDYNGNTTVTIQGYAVYYIAGVCASATCNHASLGELKKGDSWGYYVRMAGQADHYIPYNGYGTKVPVLID